MALKNVNSFDFTTDTGVNIFKRVETDKTLLFKDPLRAKEVAKQMRTYSYPVYQNGVTNGYYAVPR